MKLHELTTRIQQSVDAVPDGIWGMETASKVAEELNLDPWYEELPKGSDRSLAYGEPREGFPHLTRLELPYSMFLSWDETKEINNFSCHVKVAPMFDEMFELWLDFYGPEGIREHGLDQYGGCYNHRPPRGSSRGWSDHAYGVAVDIDPTGNPLNSRFHESRMPLEAIRLAEKAGLRNIGARIGRDFMHFAAVDYGIFQP